MVQPIQAPVTPVAPLEDGNAPLIPLVDNNQGTIPTISVGGDQPLEDFNQSESNVYINETSGLTPIQPMGDQQVNQESQTTEVYKRATNSVPKAILVELNQFNNLAVSREEQKKKIVTAAVAINLEDAMKQAQNLYASGQVEQAEKIMNMIKVKSQPAN